MAERYCICSLPEPEHLIRDLTNYYANLKAVSNGGTSLSGDREHTKQGVNNVPDDEYVACLQHNKATHVQCCRIRLIKTPKGKPISPMARTGHACM